jgi:hypothetical protein
MDSKALMIGWIAVSVLWILYWAAMTASLGVEAIGDLVAAASRPLLVAALCASVPVTLLFIGVAVSWIKRAGGAGRP